ncbi:MAG: hypothetical protein OEZ06_07045 [Myxococcales bacterium]|nr:hypothetical protein [Myxococcales bacterium]
MSRREDKGLWGPVNIARTAAPGRPGRSIAGLLVFLWGVLAVPACSQSDAVAEGMVKRDFGQFQREVYPVLLRDCGFPSCHGDRGRFFRVYGPGRVRLPGETETPGALDQPTGAEISTTHSLARSMIDENALDSSPLLRKPLAVEAGGAGHFGVDPYDRDIYRTDQDSGYQALARWVFSGETQSEEAP